MRRDPTSNPTRAARAVWAVGVVGALALGVLGGPVSAQVADDDPPRTEAEQTRADAALLETLAAAPESPRSSDDPFADVVATAEVVEEAAVLRLDATARSNGANEEALAAATDLQSAQAKEEAAILVREDAIDVLSTERARLSELSVQAYITGGSPETEQFHALVQGDTANRAAGRGIIFGQVLKRQKDITEEAQADLRAARSKLRDVRAVVAAAEREAARRLSTAAQLTQVRAAAEQAHIRAIAESEAAEAELRSAGRRPIEAVPLDIAIIGLPRLSASDLAGWFEASPYRPRVSTPIADYARWFIEEGRTEGIRGDIAFAQAVLETGGFANNDTVNANNFSGIGHCDSCDGGWKFPSPRLGVRAQIQLLKSYAVKKPNYVNKLVDRRLRGPAGCCDTWGDLTTVWATDPTYGPKVMLLYTSLVDYALDRRARGEGFDEPVTVLGG